MIPFRVVPVSIQAAILTRVINHLLEGQSLKTRLQEIDGKSVSVHVLDIPWLMHFHINNGQVRATTDSPATDVTISGKLQGFLQLISGQQDPDTLFFQRKLNVEGDTETGVHIKNLLDALEYDWDAHFDSVLVPPLAKRAKMVRQKASAYLPVKLLQKLLEDTPRQQP